MLKHLFSSAFLIAILALTVAPAAHAQLAPRYIAGATLSATPTANCIDTSDTAAVASFATMTAIVTGTATSLTVSFAATSIINPTLAAQWVALPMVPVGAGGGLGAATISTTSVGTFTAPVSGFRQVCAYLSTYSSGSVAINWNPSDKANPALTSEAMRVPFNCILAGSTATSAANFTAAAGYATGCTSVTGLRFYITDIDVASSAISTASNYPLIEYSTTLTTTCATSPVVVWAGFTLTFTSIEAHYKTPIITPQSVDLCFLHPAAGTKSVMVQGYLAP